MSRARRRAIVPAVTVSPTPERVARSDGGYSISPDGLMRVVEAPFDRLGARRQLDDDGERSRLLYEAGSRFRADWYLAGLAGSLGGGSLDGAGGGIGHPAYMIPSSERVAGHRASWRQAYRAMDDEQRRIVGYVVLDELTVTAAGLLLTDGACAATKAKRIAMDTLLAGLGTLAVHYGLIARR